MNPYEVPGLERRPTWPLCPIKHPHHENFYVGVDHSETRYLEFIDAVGDASSLIEDGRLVVAYGGEGCGKTALLNRCAKWVKDDLADRGKRAQVLTLSNESRANISVEDRQKYVFDCVIDEVRKHELVSASDLEVLRARQDDPLRGYRYLSEVLPPDVVLVVLLPTSEVAGELVDYAGFVRGKLLLLAETAYVEVDRCWSDIRAANRQAEPLRLKVEQLREDDGWLFATARQRLNREDRDYPIVTEETMRLVTTGMQASIGQLQRLLHGVYREILERRGPRDALTWPEVDEVSYEYITGFYFRASGQGLM